MIMNKVINQNVICVYYIIFNKKKISSGIHPLAHLVTRGRRSEVGQGLILLLLSLRLHCGH